jgi:parallel beta-helix repeat protein
MQPFALAYLDIDNFKSFNDRYGYGRGDEVLVVACRIPTTVVGELAGPERFVGHAGGDDFVFMSRPDAIDASARPSSNDLTWSFRISMTAAIDSRATSTPWTVGEILQFPIMSLSIAVVQSEIIGNRIHLMKAYGMYVGGGGNSLIEGNIIHDNDGFGLHLFEQNHPVNGWVIRNNIFYNNGGN